MEPVSVTAIILSILAGVGALLARLKFKHCHMCCIDSDCMNSPPSTPLSEPRKQNRAPRACDAVQDTSLEDLYIYDSTEL